MRRKRLIYIVIAIVLLSAITVVVALNRQSNEIAIQQTPEVSFNSNHPELQSGEVFLTNADEEAYKHVGWKTKRKGKTAYTIHGEPYEALFPVFVQWSELEKEFTAQGLDINPILTPAP